MRTMLTLKAMILAPAAVATCLLLGGCGAPAAPGTSAADVGSDPHLEPLADSIRRGGDSRRSPVSDNGLEVLQWIVTDDSAIVGEALALHGAEAPIDGPTQAALQENGFRFYRVRDDELAALLESLGGTSINQQWWYGQVTDWKQLHRRPLGSARRAVAIDGRVRRFEGGFFELLMRAWTVKTEEGPRLALELAPFFEETIGSDMRRLIDGNGMAGEPFATSMLRARLEPGYAYILTGEAPSVDWSEQPRGSAQAPSAVRSPGPDTFFGPDIAGPATLGELFFRGEGANAARLMLVLFPRVPDLLFPPELLPGDSEPPAAPLAQ